MTDTELFETRYAQNGELNIAYQIMGTGPLDLIFVPGLITHVEFLHEIPGYTEFLRRLAAFSRVVAFDKSGQGLSDRASGVASLEQRMDDIRAVMEDIGSRRAAILGCSEGAPISVMFAATYPERTTHLILWGGMARYTAAPDYPFVRAEDDMLRRVDAMVKHWGTGQLAIKGWLPSQAGDPEAVRRFAKLERLTFSPGALRTMYIQNMMMMDIRPVLPAVQVPTLVLHRRTDAVIPPDNGRYLASRIPGAKYIEYDDGSDHLMFTGDMRTICGDIEEFLTGTREAVEPDVERILATVLFTDVVESTRRASEMGDRAWRRVLDEHDALARRVVTQQRGRLVKTTGDGILATFDGPGRAIRCALTLVPAAEQLGLTLRVGLHTGEIELRGEDVGGIAVHAAARVMATARPGDVLVSRVVTDLVAGAGITFAPRGTHAFKGLPGEWDLFAASR